MCRHQKRIGECLKSSLKECLKETDMPELGELEGLLFTLKDITHIPDTPRMNELFLVRGKVELFKIPFIAPVWVIVTVEYPEAWWEEIIPIIGAPQVREMAMVLGADFEITFKEGFTREGVFKLTTRLYAGPTMPLNEITLPPFPPVATHETTFIVSGEVSPEEVLWVMVEEVANIVVEAGPEVSAWLMVEEVANIVVEAGPEIVAWEMVEEVANIVVSTVAPPAQYTLEVSITPSGAGYVTISPSKADYSPGEVVTLTAHPYSGYEFEYWAGVLGLPTAQIITLTMNENKKIMAVFKEIVAGRGTFGVTPAYSPIEYVQWIGEWEVEGYSYYSSWTTPGKFAVMRGPDGEDIPLTGKFSVWLDPGGVAPAVKYGPTSLLTVKDGVNYVYDIGKNVLYGW